MEFSYKNSTVFMAICIFGSVSAANLSQSSSITPNTQVSYTANGTMSKETALLLKRLLQNNKNLEIHAEVSTPRPSKYNNRLRNPKMPVEVSVNYTVTGKTTVANVRKLKRLLKTHKHIEIVAEANIDLNQAITTRFIQPTTQYTQTSPNTYYPNSTYNSAYYPSMQYGYAYQQYAGYAIQPVSQPMIWYRVPVNYGNPVQTNHAITAQQERIMQDTPSVLVAEK